MQRRRNSVRNKKVCSAFQEVAKNLVQTHGTPGSGRLCLKIPKALCAQSLYFYCVDIRGQNTFFPPEKVNRFVYNDYKIQLLKLVHVNIFYLLECFLSPTLIPKICIQIKVGEKLALFSHPFFSPFAISFPICNLIIRYFFVF